MIDSTPNLLPDNCSFVADYCQTVNNPLFDPWSRLMLELPVGWSSSASLHETLHA
jgi:hypothetical protein